MSVSPIAPAGAAATAPTLDRAIFDDLCALAETLEDGFLTGLVDQFVLETAPRLVELRHAFRSGDVPAVRRLAHGIKGSGAQIGGARLAASCDRLEQLVTTTALRRHVDLRDVEADHAELCRILARRVSIGLSLSA